MKNFSKKWRFWRSLWFCGSCSLLRLSQTTTSAEGSASSSQPVARVRAYQQAPGTNLILGDSRLAHFDMQLVNSLTGQPWQNLAFGGASLKETLDLADYILNSGHEVDTLVAEVSFYTLNAGYNTDRFAALEETLNNPLAYCFNP